jgi:oligopeptide transport system ATP-binding protein
MVEHPVTAVLEMDALTVRFATPEGEVSAVNELNLLVGPGERLAVVGESGSGKSQAFLATLGLLARNGTAGGDVRFHGQPLLGLKPAALNEIRGARMAMVFQDPMTCLTPHLSVGQQLTEVLVLHQRMDKAAARRRAVPVLEQVRIPEAPKRMDQYPHELSGGMRQRVMIAMALLCEPELLIADEPTTALDVTVQAQILALFEELCAERAMGLILITHDLGIVAGLCDRVVVMYAGRIVEQGTVRELFHAPAHPYTAGLLRSTPQLDQAYGEALETIPGQPPNLQALPTGCAFRDRCTRAVARCASERPRLQPKGEGRAVACFKPHGEAV